MLSTFRPICALRVRYGLGPEPDFGCTPLRCFTPYLRQSAGLGICGLRRSLYTDSQCLALRFPPQQDHYAIAGLLKNRALPRTTFLSAGTRGF